MKTITVEYTFTEGRSATVSIPADLTPSEKNVLTSLVEQVQSYTRNVGGAALKVTLN